MKNIFFSFTIKYLIIVTKIYLRYLLEAAIEKLSSLSLFYSSSKVFSSTFLTEKHNCDFLKLLHMFKN